jgi:hypothetical protein
MTTELPLHPLAALLPPMSEDEFARLKSSIMDNGLLEPIVMFEGAILDGRHRYKACCELGIKPEFVFPEIENPPAYVKAKNVDRRHLKESQLALIAAGFANYANGRPSKTLSADTVSMSAAAAANLVGVSVPSVNRAKRVLKEGTPEEVELVRNGKLSVNALADDFQAGLTPEERDQKRKTPNRGHNPTRIKGSEVVKRAQETKQAKANLWHHLRDALDGISSLPLPADVVSVARQYDARTGNGGVINKRLRSCIEWLEEFEHAWNAHNG